MVVKREVLNLTFHPATQEQIEAGVFDLEGEDLVELKKLLNFDVKPDSVEVKDRAIAIAKLAQKVSANSVMIGGALWLMQPLITALRWIGKNVYFAYSTRDIVEERLPDGTVKKTSVFKHGGFIDADIVIGEEELVNTLV